MTDLSASLRRLLDKAAIEEQLYRWSRGVARRNWDLVKAIFHDDAHDDHGTLNGSVDAYIEWQKRHHSGVDQSMHFLGNILVEFIDETLALVETNVIAFHHYSTEAARADIVGADAAGRMGEMTSLIAGRYLDKFQKRADEWRIAYRQAVFETARVEEAGRNLRPHWVAAQRDASDPLFRIRAEMGLGPIDAMTK